MSLPMPLCGAQHDFLAIQPALDAAQQGTPLSYELLVAQTRQESSWRLGAYRYEPNYDARYISSAAGQRRWARHPAWLTDGPTGAQWFQQHPGRQRERVASRDYGFLAQTRIAASYGIAQFMYPTAVDLGFPGTPEGLCVPATAAALMVKLLLGHYRAARAGGFEHRSALMIALARYNGGAVGNEHPAHLRNLDYVQAVNRRFGECWGRPLFPGV
jgi:hypothetical protein